MFRQEAISIPNLLVAPRSPPSNDHQAIDDDEEDLDGWYADGAYVASSDSAAINGTAPEDEDPQLAYFDSILTRYEKLRAQLQQTPPQSALDRLDRDHPTYIKALNKDLTRWWLRNLKSVDPVPAQVASFDKSSVLRLLRLLSQGTLLKRGLGVEMSISRWTWSLLARLPERGELSSEEVGVVRELGKKAVLVGMGLKEKEEWAEGIAQVEKGFDEDQEDEERGVEVVNGEEIALDEDVAEADQVVAEALKPLLHVSTSSATDTLQTQTQSMKDEANNTAEALQNPDDLTEAKARILAQLATKDTEAEINLEPEVPDVTTTDSTESAPAHLELSKSDDADIAKINTKATVDMIITVAGEVYGQRDLLEFRSQWAEVS